MDIIIYSVVGAYLIPSMVVSLFAMRYHMTRKGCLMITEFFDCVFFGFAKMYVIALLCVCVYVLDWYDEWKK